MTQKHTSSTLTDEGLYRLINWFSPSFPIGAYSYSRGLESAIESGFVNNQTNLVDWIETDLRHGPGWTDAVLFSHVFRAADSENENDLLDLAALANALRGSAELALESTAQGKAFTRTVSECWSLTEVEEFERRLIARDIEITLPVVTALSYAIGQIPLREALFFYVQANASNLVSAAVRLIPLGQSDGQKALISLEKSVCDTVKKAPAVTLDNLGTSTPMIDLMSIAHETQYTRLFRS